MEIKTAQNSYIFYPNVKKAQIIERKWYESIDNIELYKQQIAFYKKYFDNIRLDICFNYDDAVSIATLESLVAKYDLEIPDIK